MGQGLSAGAVTGVATDLIVSGTTLDVWTHVSTLAVFSALGLSVDLVSDLTAKHGSIVIPRAVLLNASDPLKHVHSFYCHNHANWFSRMVLQKHEWVILESTTGNFYTVQKVPSTGDVAIDVGNSLRAANDYGLRAAGRPLHAGETQQHRVDMDFDVNNELQVAYVIAWLRKEDPRWAFSTENSRQFTTRLRLALQDF